MGLVVGNAFTQSVFYYFLSSDNSFCLSCADNLGRVALGMNKAERAHLDAVASMGCLVCDHNGFPGTPAEIHHIGNQGVKASHFHTLPLCSFHHRNGNWGEAIHSGRIEWERVNGTEKELLAEVNARLTA